jgi:hypothetical protein
MTIETEIEAHIAAIEGAYREVIAGPNARIEVVRACGPSFRMPSPLGG